MHTTHSNTQYKNESKHSEMGDKTQSRELLVADTDEAVTGEST